MTLDLGYITHYMLEYDTGVPTAVIIGVSVFVCGIILVLFFVSISYSVFVRLASLCLFLGYFFLIFCATVLYREETFVMRYSLHPLWTYTMLYNRLLALNIMNVIMFIPFGLFLGGAMKKKHILSAIGISLAFSLFIETVQLVSTRGVFNIDDIIHNVLGCVIGFSCFMLCYKLILRSV